MITRHQIDNIRLQLIRILILVNQQPPESALIAASDVGEQLQQVDGAKQQIVEIDGVGLQEPTLIGWIDALDDAGEVMAASCAAAAVGAASALDCALMSVISRALVLALTLTLA